MNRRGFTMVELLVVLGIILILATLMLPALFSHLEGARIREMQSQLGIFQAALDRYQGAFGMFPPMSDTGDNAGIESALAALRTEEGGGPFLPEHVIKTWTTDTDGDGHQELVDPWRTPWIYFHHNYYTQGAVYYMVNEQRVQISPVTKKGVHLNTSTYQLWACGPNKLNESCRGDDVGNIKE